MCSPLHSLLPTTNHAPPPKPPWQVKPGPEGYRQFTESIRRAFSLPDDSELNITFTCDEPTTGDARSDPARVHQPGAQHTQSRRARLRAGGRGRQGPGEGEAQGCRGDAGLCSAALCPRLPRAPARPLLRPARTPGGQLTRLFTLAPPLVPAAVDTGSLLTLQGSGAYDAAVHCASVSAARRLSSPGMSRTTSAMEGARLGVPACWGERGARRGAAGGSLGAQGHACLSLACALQ